MNETSKDAYELSDNWKILILLDTWQSIVENKHLELPNNIEQIIKSMKHSVELPLVTFVPDDKLKKYKLLPNERADSDDWMPLMEWWPGHRIAVYYVNVNLQKNITYYVRGDDFLDGDTEVTEVNFIANF